MECRAECGREEITDGEKQKKDKHEETDHERSNTHHGWHEDGMKRAHRHIGVARLEPCSEYAHDQTCNVHEKNYV